MTATLYWVMGFVMGWISAFAGAVVGISIYYLMKIREMQKWRERWNIKKRRG